MSTDRAKWIALGLLLGLGTITPACSQGESSDGEATNAVEKKSPYHYGTCDGSLLIIDYWFNYAIATESGSDTPPEGGTIDCGAPGCKSFTTVTGYPVAFCILDLFNPAESGGGGDCPGYCSNDIKICTADDREVYCSFGCSEHGNYGTPGIYYVPPSAICLGAPLTDSYDNPPLPTPPCDTAGCI